VDGLDARAFKSTGSALLPCVFALLQFLDWITTEPRLFLKFPEEKRAIPTCVEMLHYKHSDSYIEIDHILHTTIQRLITDLLYC